MQYFSTTLQVGVLLVGYISFVYFPPPRHVRSTYVKRLSVVCEIDVIGQNLCHGYKRYWFILAECARVVYLRVSTWSRMYFRARMCILRNVIRISSVLIVSY